MVRATKILSVCLSLLFIQITCYFVLESINILFLFFFLCFLRGSHTNAHPNTPWLHARETGLLLIFFFTIYNQ